MTAWLSMTVAFLAGFGLGLLFFGGLWLTVRALPKSRHPAVLALGSFWGRTAVVVLGFVVVMAGRWENTIVSVGGFLLARIVVSRWIPRSKQHATGVRS